jgi:hypothetical protein
MGCGRGILEGIEHGAWRKAKREVGPFDKLRAGERGNVDFRL